MIGLVSISMKCQNFKKNFNNNHMLTIFSVSISRLFLKVHIGRNFGEKERKKEKKIHKFEDTLSISEFD